jgi:hypothetical protein
LLPGKVKETAEEALEEGKPGLRKFILKKNSV